MKRMLETYRAQKALRRMRLAQESLEWTPKPVRPSVRLRQSWCFLTRHKMMFTVQPAEDEDEHSLLIEYCLRCGLALAMCADCPAEME